MNSNLEVNKQSRESKENSSYDSQVAEEYDAEGAGKLDDNNVDEVEAIAKRETRVVCGLRLVVLTVLVASTILLAFGVHRYLDEAEQEAFHKEFHADATKVLQAMGARLDETLGAVDALAVSMTSHARATNQTWPFVTMPDFAVRATKARLLAHSVYLAVHHVVTREERAVWEAYTPLHNDWVNASVHAQAIDPKYQGPLVYGSYNADYIRDFFEEPVPERDVYLPTWQVSPVIPYFAVYNWDGLSWTDTRSYLALLERKTAVITEAYQLPDPNNEDEMAEHEEQIAWISDYVNEGQNPDEPISDITYPVLDTQGQISVLLPKQEPVVGMIAFSVYWRELIQDILPDNARGVVVVVESVQECNPTFSFQIDGPDVTYLGRGDHHDPTYDDLERTALLTDLSGLSAGDSSYSGVPVDTEFCPFRVRIFPSKLKETDFTSNDPISFSLAVAGIFLFTSLVFIAYDQGVEYRQRQVLSQANQSSAIVASLFPKSVRDRLYEEEKQKKLEESLKAKKQKQPEARQANSLDDGSAYSTDLEIRSSIRRGDLSLVNGPEGSKPKGKPIADLFPHTTIL